jgi:hypothetical protein
MAGRIQYTILYIAFIGLAYLLKYVAYTVNKKPNQANNSIA